MTTFRAPTIELPAWVNASFSDVNGAAMLLIRDPCAMDAALLSVAQAEALLEVLLDICPNAHALAGARLNATLCNVAHWIERGCDPLQAAKELRLLANGGKP